jgi:hypothetical protein
MSALNQVLRRIDPTCLNTKNGARKYATDKATSRLAQHKKFYPSCKVLFVFLKNTKQLH